MTHGYYWLILVVENFIVAFVLVSTSCFESVVISCTVVYVQLSIISQSLWEYESSHA